MFSFRNSIAKLWDCWDHSVNVKFWKHLCNRGSVIRHTSLKICGGGGGFFLFFYQTRIRFNNEARTFLTLQGNNMAHTDLCLMRLSIKLLVEIRSSRRFLCVPLAAGTHCHPSELVSLQNARCLKSNHQSRTFFWLCAVELSLKIHYCWKHIHLNHAAWSLQAECAMLSGPRRDHQIQLPLQ